MSNNCSDDQVSREGSGREKRFLPALDTSIPLIDDRGPEDILLFAKHYAKLVRFYEADQQIGIGNAVNNLPESDLTEELTDSSWKQFFCNDIAIVVASISQYKNKIDWIRQQYEDTKNLFYNDSKIENFRIIFRTIIDHFERINKWYERSITDHPLKNELEVKIKSSLLPALQHLIAYGRGYSALKEGRLKLRDHYDIFKAYPWNIVYDKIKPDETIYAGETREQKIIHATLFLDDVFAAVLKVYKDLTERSGFYFNAAIENYPQHQPHMALFIAFVRLFSYAQNELNGLTKRHLEFYYRDILHLKEHKAGPDAVYLIYQLAKEATGFDLAKHSPLFAGKDATGKDLIYETEDKLVINKAIVKELKTLFLDKKIKAAHSNELIEADYEVKNIYAAPIARSIDGLGTPFKVPETAWPALGYFNAEEADVITGEIAEIGFAIASPQLFLAEGLRKIKLIIDATNLDLNFLKDSIEIHLTGEKDWRKVTINQPDLTTAELNTLNAGTIDAALDAQDASMRYFVDSDLKSININIPAAESSIIAYDKKIHGEGYNSSFPIIKVIIKSQVEGKYDLLKNATLNSIAIIVEVSGITTFTLSNDDAPIDEKKAFHPFTLIPKPNTGLTIRNQEVFSKKLSHLEIFLEKKFPGNVSTYLDELKSGQEGITLDSFHAESQIFYKNEWYELNSFGESNDIQWAPSEADSIVFSSKNKSNIDFFERRLADPANTNSPGIESSTLKFLLHYYADNENVDTDIFHIISLDRKNPPQTYIYYQTFALLLELKAIRIDYMSEQSYEANIEQLFHIYPFGTTEIYPLFGDQLPLSPEELNKDKDRLLIQTRYLMPQFKFGIDEKNRPSALQLQPRSDVINELRKNYSSKNQYSFEVFQQGNLYIGIENLVLPQNLSLLFKIADGTAEDNDNDPPKINWSYLVNNEWRPMPDENIISDSTYGLQTTGILLVDFPENANTNNSIITRGLHWLCLSVNSGADKIPKIIDVIAQANKAIFSDRENDPEHYRNPLPAGSITKLVTKVPEVKVITQPFESFDGKMREEGKVFYARASERLRHKNRAITAWDYEHIVLEHFPGIYKVKCITHTDHRCLCRHEDADETKPCCCGQVAPGHVLIVPVSNLRNKSAIDILKPRTGRRTLLQIEELLKKLTSPFVHVHAKNPLFEEIKISFNVKFNTGTDKGRYLKQLNEDIVKFLSPWAFDEKKEILFGEKIYASNIINSIEELEYVNYITCFRMIHIVKDCCESLDDISCADLGKQLDISLADDKKTYDRLVTEIKARSPRAILTSVKQHCIRLIDDTPVAGDCSCGNSH